LATQFTASGVGPGYEQMIDEQRREAMRNATKNMVCFIVLFLICNVMAFYLMQKAGALKSAMDAIHSSTTKMQHDDDRLDDSIEEAAKPVYGAAVSRLFVLF
jgi:hypothetical protein